MEKKGRGGSREGAGRPATGRTTTEVIAVRCTKGQSAAIREMAKARGETISRLVLSALGLT